MYFEASSTSYAIRSILIRILLFLSMHLKKSRLTDKGFTLHKLRHTYASHLIQSGVDLLSVQQLLGHSDLNSTKIYTHVDTAHLKTQIEKYPFK